MSLAFATGHYLTGASNITLPNSDWCVAASVFISDHAGVERNTVASAGATASTLEFTLGTLRLQDPGSTPGSALMRLADGTNPMITLSSTTLDVPVSSWFMLIGQRNGSTKELYTVQVGAATSPVLVASSTATLGALTLNTPMMIGRRYCRQIVNDDMKGTIAWVARGAFALTTAQMTALARLYPPRMVAPWDEYLPLITAQGSYVAPIGGGTYTVTGSWPPAGKQTVRLW